MYFWGPVTLYVGNYFRGGVQIHAKKFTCSIVYEVAIYTST